MTDESPPLLAPLIMPKGSQCGVKWGAAPTTAPRLDNAMSAGHRSWLVLLVSLVEQCKLRRAVKNQMTSFDTSFHSFLKSLSYHCKTFFESSKKSCVADIKRLGRDVHSTVGDLLLREKQRHDVHPDIEGYIASLDTLLARVTATHLIEFECHHPVLGYRGRFDSMNSFQWVIILWQLIFWMFKGLMTFFILSVSCLKIRHAHI